MGRLCLRFHGEQDICPQGGTQSGHRCPQAHPTVILRHRTQGRGRHFGAKAGGVPRTNVGSSRGGRLALTLKDGPRADRQLPPLPRATTRAALPRGRISVVTTWGELLASGGWRPGTLLNTPLAGDTVAGHSEGTAPQRIISFMSFLWLPQQRTTNRGLKTTEFIPLVWRPESQMTMLGRGPGGGSFLPLPGGSEAQDLSTSLGGHGS